MRIKIIKFKIFRNVRIILYQLMELVPLWGLMAHIAHQPAALHDPQLESSKLPAEAALHDIQAKERGAVDGVLLRVAHQFEHDGTRPWDGYEHEALHVKDRLWYSICCQVKS